MAGSLFYGFANNAINLRGVYSIIKNFIFTKRSFENQNYYYATINFDLVNFHIAFFLRTK